MGAADGVWRGGEIMTTAIELGVVRETCHRWDLQTWGSVIREMSDGISNGSPLPMRARASERARLPRPVDKQRFADP